MAAFTVKDLIKEVAAGVGAELAEKLKDSHGRAKERDRKNAHVLLDDDKPLKANPFRKHKLADTPVDEMSTEERSLMAARCVRYIIAARHDQERAIDMAKAAGDKTIAEEWEKALGTTVLADGGSLIPPEFAAGIIEELGAKAVVRKMGVPVMPMNAGSLTLPYIDQSATAAYVTEGADATASQPTTGQLQLMDKELVSLIILGNRLLRNGGSKVDNLIRQHLIRVMSRKEDLTFIRSTGASGEPRGMRYQADQTNNVTAANGTVNLTNVTADAIKCIDGLEGSDVDMENSVGWLMHPRTKNYLRGVLDSNGNKAFPEIPDGDFMGIPYATTTQIPKNLGGGSNESELYLAAFGELVIAENDTLMIDAFDGGAYYDGSTVRSGISRNQTAVRAVQMHDFGAQRRGKEIFILTAVKWFN